MPPQPFDAPVPLGRPVDESGPVGHGLMSAGRPGVPFIKSQHHLASSGRSGATLRALLPDSPQKVRDVLSRDNQAEILYPEAEAYANVGASISLPDLAVGAAATVGAPTSPPVLDVVADANVRATTSLAIGLGQTTQHTPSQGHK